MTFARFTLLLRLGFWFVMLSVLVLSLMPSPPEELSTGWDKANHFLAFMVLMLLGSTAYTHDFWRLPVGLLLCGVLIEALQSFTPTRSVEFLDVVADALGVLSGLLVYRFYRFLPPLLRSLRGKSKTQ